MVQYILNTTAIWLISLLCYDLFLKRESYHGYNRAYLLITFVMGALMPLWQWQSDDMLHQSRLQEPAEQLINAKQRIVATGSAPVTASLEQWLMLLYMAGAAIALCILLADIIKMVRLTYSAQRSKYRQWTIMETGEDHAPFSLRHTLYVCSKQQYSDDEWAMILTHEARHTTLLHLADLLLMQLARIIFWFHPLVYVYNKRLLMVHEYQADNTAVAAPSVYCQFLVEQALLQRAPSVSHSFNRSPIKNRIVMLTRKSSAASKVKMLVSIPLAVVCITCFSKNSFSQKFERKGNIVTYKGNRFELSKEQRDTMIITDPITNEQLTKVAVKDPVPEKMNAKPIANIVDRDPAYTGTDKDLRDYLVRGLKTELSKLEDGQYRLDISNVVIDANGKVVYFDYHDMRRSKTADELKNVTPANPNIVKQTTPDIKVNVAGNPAMGSGPFTVRKTTDPSHYEDISKANQQAIFNKVCKLMDAAPAFTPAILKGKKVPAMYYDMRFNNTFKIDKHVVYDRYQSLDYQAVN